MFSLFVLFAQDVNKALSGVNDPAGIKYTRGTKIGLIITDLIPYVLVLAGIILLFFLISGGFDLLTSAGDPKKTEAGKEKITSAIVGFIIVFVSYWLYQLVLFAFGIKQ